LPIFYGVILAKENKFRCFNIQVGETHRNLQIEFGGKFSAVRYYSLCCELHDETLRVKEREIMPGHGWG
jgi:hypothetical protein